MNFALKFYITLYRNDVRQRAVEGLPNRFYIHVLLSVSAATATFYYNAVCCIIVAHLVPAGIYEGKVPCFGIRIKGIVSEVATETAKQVVKFGVIE